MSKDLEKRLDVVESLVLWIGRLKGVSDTDKLNHDQQHAFKLLYRARPSQNRIVAVQYNP